MKPLDIDASAAARFLKALANENRLVILCELLEGERCVNELERVVGLSQSALSQHLALLRRDELVQTRREGKTICYSLNGRALPVLIEILYRLFSVDAPQGDHAGPAASDLPDWIPFGCGIEPRAPIAADNPKPQASKRAPKHSLTGSLTRQTGRAGLRQRGV
jgi:DNA-binding transcriptional ArsR family regulator